MRYFRSREDEEIIEGDPAMLQHELEEAEQTIRSLTRQVSREHTLCTQVATSYNRVVAELVQVSRANAEIERERDMWRQKAERGGEHAGKLNLTPAEVRAIRKAIARLHHPDTGGDAERMKLWNAVLDQLEE